MGVKKHNQVKNHVCDTWLIRSHVIQTYLCIKHANTKINCIYRYWNCWQSICLWPENTIRNYWGVLVGL